MPTAVRTATRLRDQDDFTGSLTDGLFLQYSSGTGKFSLQAAGTVSSVSMTVPGFLSVAGSPINTSGTLALSLVSQSANLVFAGPTTSSSAPTFRSLVTGDLPSGIALTASANTFTVGPQTINIDSGGHKGLVIKSAASPSVNLFEIQNSATTPSVYVDSGFNLNLPNSGAFTANAAVQCNYCQDRGSTRPYINLEFGATTIGVSPRGTGQVLWTLRGASGHTSNLQEWQSNTPTVLSAVDANGYMVQVTGAGAPSSTPADGALYVDTTNAKLYVRTGGAWKSVTVT